MRTLFSLGLATLLLGMMSFSSGAVPMVPESDPVPLAHSGADENPAIGEDLASQDEEPGDPDTLVDRGDQLDENGVLTDSESLLTGLNDAVMTLSELESTDLTLNWEVRTGLSYGDTPVGGAIVQIQGPETPNTWGSITTVVDCASEDCADSLDKDPRPGFFSITQRRVGAGDGFVEFNPGETYRISAVTPAPTGYTWTTSSTVWEEMAYGAWLGGQLDHTFDEPLRLIPSPSVAWQVKAGDTAAGGGVVSLEGPRNGNGSWDRKVEVADCIAETQCPGISMDQDPRPGYFKVFTTRLGTATGFETHAILADRQYRIIPFNSPLGYQWNSTSPVEMTGGVSWNATTNSLDFGALQVGQSATLSWDVSDQAANPVGGGTIQIIRGSYATDPRFYVTDCTLAPCHPESMDQDPAPGKFRIDTLRGFSADGLTKYVDSVSVSQLYTVKPIGSITGYSWASTTPVTVPSGRDLDYRIADVKVNTRDTSSNVCTVENQNKYYTLAGSGSNVSIKQLEHNAGDTQILSTVTGMPGSDASLIRGDHAADALGVTPTGVFYFTGQKPLPSGTVRPSDNEAARITTIYRYDPSGNSPPYPVFDMDLLSPTTGTVVSGDATIYQGREEFYFAYYSNAPGGNGIRFHLYRYSHGSGERTGEVYHIDVPKPANFGDRFDGDFTFDKQNNLQFIISDASSNSKGAVVSGVVNAEDFQDAPSVHVLSSVTTIQGTANSGTISGGPINGVAFTAGGKGIIQQYSTSAGTTDSLVTLPGLAKSTSTSWKNTRYEDLASCNTPTTITIQKNLVGARYNPEDQFTLSAYRQDGNSREDFSSTTTTGGESGIQRDQVGPFVLTLSGELHAKEDFPSPTTAQNYTTTWSCHVRLGNGLLDVPFIEGEGTELSFSLTGKVQPGADMVCIFTNITQRSALTVTKKVDATSGSQVDGNAHLTYTLRFDNSAGTVDAAVDHTDHLQDVLDDAAFVNAEQPGTPFIAIPEGQQFTVTWVEQDTQISITGSVPPGNIWELSYVVEVKPNNAARDGTHTDFYLNSFLTPSGDAAPDSCLIDDQQNPTCTTNPINAWTVSKDSRPASGARLHAGGNVHYRLAADKLTPGTMIDDLVFTDDLSDVFKTAGFAPDAAVPAGALARGIYFFDSAGYTLEGVDSPDIFASRNNQQTIQTPAPAYTESHVPVPQPVGDKWLLTSTPVAVPKNAVRAELWFAVEVGAPKEAPGSWPKVDNVVQTPKTGATFTNAVTATATAAETSTTFDPVRCATTDIEADLAGCTVTHELQDNYFTIRKDAQGPGASAIHLKSDGTVVDPAYGIDPTGIWNMIGHVFEIRDHDSNSNTPTAYPSLKLCRKDYDPRNASNWNGTDGTWIVDQPAAWNGEFSVSNPLDPTMFDWAEESATLAAIQSWNSAHPDKQLPLCGLLYEQGDIDDLAQSTAGGQTGRWRSENLPQGNYWLVETKAPTHQISNDGTKKREVPGIQLLAQPIAFTVWPDTAAPEGPANQGAGQLDISPTGSFNNDWLARCSPGAEAKLRPTACVNPTGYLLLVKDITSLTLPLSGGTSLAIITGTGVMLLLLSGIGIFWWRRRE